MSGFQTANQKIGPSERHGAKIWKAERYTSIVLVFLIGWGVWAAGQLVGAGPEAQLAWIASPMNALPLAALIFFSLWHMEMGLRVVIEDYVHGLFGKLLLILNIIFCWGLGLVAVAAFARIVFGFDFGVR